MKPRAISDRVRDILEPIGLLWLVYHMKRAMAGDEFTREEAEALDGPVAAAIDFVGPIPELRALKDAMRRADIHGSKFDIVPGQLGDFVRQFHEDDPDWYREAD